MALTKYTASTAIIAALSDLPNATDGLTPAQLKAKFDENPEAFKTYINNTLIPALEATTDGASGADNIGATTISGLTGNDVQTLLEALKTLVDTKSNSTDIYTRTALNNGQLDTRYFTETELNSTTDNNSGADKIGATPISTSPSTVQGVLEWLKQQIDNTTLGQIPDGSITDAKLSDEATDLKARFNTHETNNSNPHNVTASQVGAPSTTDFNAHLANIATETTLGHVKAKTETDGTLILPSGVNVVTGTISDGGTIPQTPGFNNYQYFVSFNYGVGYYGSGSKGPAIRCSVDQSTRVVTCQIAAIRNDPQYYSIYWESATANFIEIAW